MEPQCTVSSTEKPETECACAFGPGKNELLGVIEAQGPAWAWCTRFSATRAFASVSIEQGSTDWMQSVCEQQGDRRAKQLQVIGHRLSTTVIQMADRRRKQLPPAGSQGAHKSQFKANHFLQYLD